MATAVVNLSPIEAAEQKAKALHADFAQASAELNSLSSGNAKARESIETLEQEIKDLEKVHADQIAERRNRIFNLRAGLGSDAEIFSRKRDALCKLQQEVTAADRALELMRNPPRAKVPTCPKCDSALIVNLVSNKRCNQCGEEFDYRQKPVFGLPTRAGF